MDVFPYSFSNKRYHTYDYYLKNTFSTKCAKIGLDGGFTCPNRDGSKGVGGCLFCAGGGSEERNSGLLPLKTQYEEHRKRIFSKWGAIPSIVYFQSYSSTYAPLPKLKQLYEEALSFEDVVGINIATRADCLEKDTLDYLAELSERTVLTVELGLQTIHNETAKNMNRCHTFDEFLEGYFRLKERKIPVCVHLINGLPMETKEMMVESARTVGKLRPDFVKIHSLYYRSGTALGASFQKGEQKPLSMEEYVDIVIRQLEVLPMECVIARLTGDADRSSLYGPLWTLQKKKVLALIDRTMKERETLQGLCYKCTNYEHKFLNNQQKENCALDLKK